MTMPRPEDGDREGPSASERPAPGETLNSGATTAPRQAATLILLRDDDDQLEVLLVKRNPKARFMGGVWVFPGGAVDAGDGDGDGDRDGDGELDAHRVAAVRELREEAGIELENPAELIALSRWITPAEVKIRYDTLFFLALLPDGQEPRIDGEECVDWGWFSPSSALKAHASGEIALVFPTIAHLNMLAPFAATDAVLAHARGLTIEPVLPKVIVEGDSARVLLPGDPGY
jgi:8-oxo-dGTP pyrophosphatase MutT (NUDIX family)